MFVEEKQTPRGFCTGLESGGNEILGMQQHPGLVIRFLSVEASLEEPIEADRPQLAGYFHRLGPHNDYDWTPLPWQGVSTKFCCSTASPAQLWSSPESSVEQDFPEHFHTTVQTLFLISGRLRSGDTLIEPGTFNIIPAGQWHGPFCAEEDAI